MIRNLFIIAVAGAGLAILCGLGAVALGGPQLLQHGWTIVDVRESDGHTIFNTPDGRVTVTAGHELQTRSLPWAGASALTVAVPGDVTFRQAAEYSVSVTGPASIVDRIRIEGDRLSIVGEGQRGQLRLDRDGFRMLSDTDRLRVVVSGPNVERFVVEGSGDLTIEGYDRPSMAVVVEGSGDVLANGRTAALTLEVTGSGDADLAAVRAGSVEVTVSGSGDAEVAPSGAAAVVIDGSGDVTLATRPSVLTQTVNGSGEVMQRS
ncbi:MAG TPA: DUF2807 domain-containing protein [Caulobacteraceae bacterium]|jgi:hypothetical protein